MTYSSAELGGRTRSSRKDPTYRFERGPLPYTQRMVPYGKQVSEEGQRRYRFPTRERGTSPTSASSVAHLFSEGRAHPSAPPRPLPMSASCCIASVRAATTGVPPCRFTLPDQNDVDGININGHSFVTSQLSSWVERTPNSVAVEVTASRSAQGSGFTRIYRWEEAPERR